MIPAIEVPLQTQKSIASVLNKHTTTTKQNSKPTKQPEQPMTFKHKRQNNHNLLTYEDTGAKSSSNTMEPHRCTMIRSINEITPSQRINLIEKSVIIHKDENGFGIRVKGQGPVFVEHVHENGAAWRAGVRRSDLISKVNGSPVANMDHKEVVSMFKSCSRFVGLTLLSSATMMTTSLYNKQLAGDSSINRYHDDQQNNLCKTIDGTTTLANLKQHRSSSQCHLLGLLVNSTCSDNSSSARTLANLKHQYHLTSNNKQTSFDCCSNYQHSHSRHKSTDEQQYCNESDQQNFNRQPLIHGNNNTESETAYMNNKQQYNVVSTARRSGSVLYRPYHMGAPGENSKKLEQFTTSGNNNGDDDDEDDDDRCKVDISNKDQPAKKLDSLTNNTRCLCSSCRSMVMEQSEYLDMAACDQCRLIRSSMGLTERTSSAYRIGANLDELDMNKFELDRLIRSRQSLKDTTLNDFDRENIKIKNNDGPFKPFNESTRDPERHFKFKLSQSASTNSLPIESIKLKTDNRSSSSIQTNKRLEIIRELIDTERTHTDRLRCLDELFYRPLKSGGFMTNEQLRSVFSCHRTLFKIHRQIYRILLSVNYNLYPEPLIGSALIEIFEGDLKRRLERAACNFCASQSTNVDLLNKLTRRDTKVGEFLAQVTSQQMVGRLGIKDLLASCFQRLTKYPLLLENLLKATPQVPEKIDYKSRRSRARLEGEDIGAAGGDSEDDYDNDDRLEDDSQRIMAISLAEEREFIERALNQTRQILVRVNDSVKVAISHNKLKEIWKRTDKYPGVPLIDIAKQQVVHEGLLTLRLSKRSFDVYVLLLNDYIIILTREGQDKYRLKFFTPDGKSSNNQSVYSPVFVIDEHLTTRDAATDENGFYLLCKRKDDSRIYEFASRSPAERSRWRDRIQWTIERQMGKGDRRRSSCESAMTKSSSEISSNRGENDDGLSDKNQTSTKGMNSSNPATGQEIKQSDDSQKKDSPGEPIKIEGTISLVEDDGIIQPSKMESSQALVNQAIQVNICDIVEKATVAS